MDNRKRHYSLAILLAGLILGAAGMWLSDHGTATGQTTRPLTPEGFEFGVTTPVLKYHFPRKGSKAMVYKGTWIAENVEEVRPDYEIDSAEVRLGAEPVVFFSLKKPDHDWPAGLYRLEIRADNRLVHTERFLIR